VTSENVIEGIIIAAASVVSSLVAVRTRFALIEARIERDKSEAATQRQHDKEMLDSTLADIRADIQRHHTQARNVARASARRQKVTLELVADIAHSMNISHRALGVDALVRTIIQEQHSDSEEGGSGE
jgi:hypothetical protein